MARGLLRPSRSAKTSGRADRRHHSPRGDQTSSLDPLRRHGLCDQLDRGAGRKHSQRRLGTPNRRTRGHEDEKAAPRSQAEGQQGQGNRPSRAAATSSPAPGSSEVAPTLGFFIAPHASRPEPHLRARPRTRPSDSHADDEAAARVRPDRRRGVRLRAVDRLPRLAPTQCSACPLSCSPKRRRSRPAPRP